TPEYPARLNCLWFAIDPDASEYRGDLPTHAAGVVFLAVAGGNLAHLAGHLGVAARRQVRVQVMLDLVAQVAGENVEQRATFQVAGAAQLAQIPVAAAFVF